MVVLEAEAPLFIVVVGINVVLSAKSVATRDVLTVFLENAVAACL